MWVLHLCSSYPGPKWVVKPTAGSGVAQLVLGGGGQKSWALAQVSLPV